MKIVFFFDTPHLLKNIRNNLMKYDININGKIVQWKCIEQVYIRDRSMKLRFAPKLTDKHVVCSSFDKMCICLAAQLLSRSDAAGIYTYSQLGALPTEAEETANLICQMDKLFDLFNSSHIRHYKESRCAFNDEHLENLNNNNRFMATIVEITEKSSLYRGMEA